MNAAIYRAERNKKKLLLFRPHFQNRHKIFAIEKALLDGNPVIVTLKINQAFQSLINEDRYWVPDEGDITAREIQTVLVVGFNEDEEAFELMNF